MCICLIQFVCILVWIHIRSCVYLYRPTYVCVRVSLRVSVTAVCMHVCLHISSFQYYCMSLCGRVCLSVCLFACASVPLCVYLLGNLSVCIIRPLSISVYMYPTHCSICLSLHEITVCLSLSVCPWPSASFWMSLCLSFCLSISLSVSLSVSASRLTDLTEWQYSILICIAASACLSVHTRMFIYLRMSIICA